eukprot:g3123.t1
MGTTQSSEGKDQEDAWAFSRQNLDTREKTRKVSLPKIWRAPYGEFTKELPRENSKLRATSSFAILSNRDPNERFNRALRSIKDNRKDFFSGRKECDPTKVICSDALYSLAAAMRFARLSQSGETAHPEVAALKLKLTDVDLSHCTGVLYRYEELGYTANPFSKESLLPFSHVRALLPLALGGGSTRKSLTNASNSADETREELKMFQAAQILVSRSPDNTVNIMLDNGEFLPAIPLQSVSFADDEEKNGWYTPLYCRASKVESSSVEDDGAAGSTAPEISVAARVTMGRRKDHGFFAAGASARARLSNLVGDVKVEIPPGTVIAKCMIQVKNVFGTAVATAREIIDVMASATMPKIHQRNIVRLNDAESTSEESPFWHDQQKRCFVFLIWVHDEKSFLGQFNDDYDRKAEELHKQLDAAFDFHFNENSLASSAGKDMGVCVFPSGGASKSVTMTPKDHEGVLYTIPLRYLLANMRRSGKKPSPFAKEVKKHLEQRQAMVLAKRAEDANTEGQGQGGEDAENTEGDGEEYEGVLLDSRQPRKTPYEESVYDVLIPRERAIVHETYRLSIQLGGMERAAMGDSQSGSASSSTEGGWCSSTGKDGFLDVVELDFPLAKGGTSLPPILQNRTKCVILKEANSASSIGPLTYTNPALVTPTGVTKETWEELRMKTVDNCLFYMGRDGKTYMKRGAVEGAGNSHKHQAPENTYLFSDMDQNSYAVVTSKKGRRGSDYDTDRLMRGSATEADQDDKFFDKNKTNGEQDDAAGAWVRVMPCLRQGDAVRVRDYSNISLPSRIISCNDNTYDVRLSDGSLRNSIKRSDLWLEPTIELKLSALAVDSLQENEELYGSAESSRSFYPTEPLPKHAIVILRLNQELSTDGPEELRNVLALGQIVDTSGEDPDRYYASVNSSAGQMPGEYSDDGLKPYKTFEYTIKLLNEETSSFPKMHSMAEWKSLMETIKPGKGISTLYYTKLRRGYDFQVYYPLPTKQVLKKNEIDAMEGCRVFLANEFKPAFVASPHNGDEGRSNMDPGEGSLSVECRAQFDMQETSNVEHNAASNMLASLWTPQPKVVHWAYDVRESHYGFVLEDVATIIEEPFSLSSTSTSIDKRYTVEFTDENNRARRFNVPTWELWPIKPSSDASPPSTEGSLVRIKVRGDGSGKKSFRYYVGKVEAIDRSMGHNFVYTVRVRTSKYTNIKTPGTALAMTFDVLKENIQTVIDLKKGDEVMCSLYDKGLCWARYNNNGVDRAELRECSIVSMKVPKAMQNRWLSLPSTRRVCAARNAGAYSVTDEGDFTIDDMGTMLTNAVYDEQLHEPVNSQDRDNGDYGLYDYDVMFVSTGEVLKNVDPLRLALPTPGARVSCGVNLNDLRTGVIVSSLPISGRENEDEDGKPNHVFVRDNQNRNYLVENCLQAGEDLLPPSPGDLLSVLDNIPSVGEMLGLDDEDENQNVAPTFNPNMVITDRRGLAAPEYEYVIELDNLIVRSPLENDSRKKHVGSFFSEVANSSTAKISLNRLHGIEIDDSLYGYVDSDDEETPEAESSGILTDLKELPLVLLIHPYESEERISAPNKSSSTFLGAVKDQIVESLPQFQGVYNPDVEERAYRVGNIVSVPIADSVQDTLEPQYEYFILTKPENKDVAVENAQLYSDLRPGKSWELWEPKYSGTWKQSLDNEENSNSCVCYSLKGPYVGALPSLYGDLDDYKVGDGQNGSTQSNQKQPFTINREIEENGARPLCKLGMHAWVRRTVKGTVLLRNNGTYDVKRDTASALKAIENGMNVERPITIPASHVEAVRTPESKEYDTSSLVELFVQARNCLRSLNLNYTDIGIHGAKALRILLEGVSSSYSDADNAGGSDESAERVDPLDTFYQNFSTFKADKTIRLRQPLITTLALRACGLGMDGLNELSRAMSSNNSITALDLGMNNLGDEGVFCVARVLAKQPSLRRLDLRGNAITGIGAQHLARGIAQFQIGVITNSHPALDVQLQDKLFLAGVPYKAIQLCEGDHILVSRETQNNYLHCQVKEIIDDDLIKVEPEGFTGAEFPTVNCSRVTLPWSYLIEHNYQVRIKYERHVKVLSVSGLNRKGYEKAQVQYITQKTYRMGEVVIKKDVTGEEFYWHIRTGKKLGNVKDTSNGITTNHQAGTITFEVEDSENEEYFEMVPFKFLRNKPLNNFSNEYDKSTTFDYQIFRKGYKRAVVFAPLARVFRATESYDVKMFAENHQVVNKIPAAKTFTQPIDSGEYIELSVPRCRIRSLVGSYVGLGAVVEVQPRGRVCRLEELILDGNDVADLLVTKGFGRMDGLIALIHSVAGRSTMRHLSLRGTALGDRGAKIIAKCLAHPHNRCHGGGWGLESLDVSQCQIRVDGLRNLVAMSSANSWLKEVIFAGNPSTKFIIEAAKSPLPGRGNNAGVKETLETTIERKMKFSENLRNVRNSTNATLGGAGSKIDSEKSNGDNFFPTAYACQEVILDTNSAHEAQSTEEEKAATEGKKEPEIASGDPEKVNEVKWHFPVAYYDNLDVLFLATERKDMQNPEELQDDENNVLYHYGAGCALKYDVPLLVPNATHKHKKMVRQRHLVRIGAGMAALLKNEDESIRQFLGRHDLSLSEFGEMVDNFNLQLFDLSKITV